MTIVTMWVRLMLLAIIPAVIRAPFTLNNFHCTFNPDTAANAKCQLSKVGNAYYTTVGLTILKPTDNVWLHLQLRRKVKENYEIFGINMKLSICEHDNTGEMNHFLMNFFLSTLKKLKNFRCPLFGNISATRFRAMLPMAQAFVPPSDYVLNFHLTGTKQNTEIITGNLSYTVVAAVKSVPKQ